MKNPLIKIPQLRGFRTTERKIIQCTPSPHRTRTVYQGADLRNRKEERELARVYVEVFGCSANRADSEMVRGLLLEAGHTIAPKPQAADASVVLTCTVKTPTEKRVIKRIRRLSEGGAPLVVASCMPKAQRELVAETAPQARQVGPDNILDIVDAVEAAIRGSRVEALKGGDPDRTCLPRVRTNPVIHIAPIASGCPGDCSYCIVKRARGDLSAFPPEGIIEDARRALEEGCREIWLTTEDTAAYRRGSVRLPQLLEGLSGLEGRFFIRVGMMTPSQVTPILEELVETFGSERVYKFLHLPLQSGNDEILARMKRHYTVENFLHIVESFREAFPMLTLSTDVICGFPGETEEQFEDSLKIVEAVVPDVLNISRFWPRPGTEAAGMEEQLHGRETKERSRRLSSLWRRLGLEGSQRWVGWEGEVLVDEEGKDGGVVGRNYAYKPVALSEPLRMGDFARVRVTEARRGYLLGETT
ncbi:MAG: tRNA (N(6)-L-threonylcarbamoyladenosine(37)-C(2))-methylthiotransferase [Candidatus Bathyarchaeota archaeon]|nr:MAG: tRNA (N(6)-L-threonylcarbamoyladenosine(37)-C(2))-methylthiotransferase [Candidatus Bathyarchaeota archaeon]